MEYTTRILSEGMLLAPDVESANDDDAIARHEEACASVLHSGFDMVTVQTFHTATGAVLAETLCNDGTENHVVGAW